MLHAHVVQMRARSFWTEVPQDDAGWVWAARGFAADTKVDTLSRRNHED